MQVTALFDMRDVERGIAAARTRARAVTQFFREVIPAMREDQRDHAKERSGPDGKWPARSPATVAAHRKMPRRPLGRLTTAVGYRASSKGAIAESRVPWSGSHQDGDRVGHGATLPARTFLWISERFLGFAEDVLGARILRAFGGA